MCSIVNVKYCMHFYLDNCSKRFHSSYEWNNARWSSGKRRKKHLQILPKSSNSILPHCYSCWQIRIAKSRPTVSCMVGDWIWYARLYILEIQMLVEYFSQMHLLNEFDLIFQWTRLHMSFPIRRQCYKKRKSYVDHMSGEFTTSLFYHQAFHTAEWKILALLLQRPRYS